MNKEVPTSQFQPTDEREADDTPAGSGQPRTLSEYPAGPASRRLALVLVVASLGMFLALVPIADRFVGVASWFIPMNQPVLIINDLITATLLSGCLRLHRHMAILVLACGYLYSALMALIHLLSFPGALAPRGLRGRPERARHLRQRSAAAAAPSSCMAAR